MTQKRNLETTRTAILVNALQIAEEEGWHGFSINRLAVKSSTSRQWIHKQFGSRLEVVHAVMNYLFTPWFEKQKKIIESEKPLNETIELSLRLMVDSSPQIGAGFQQLYSSPPDFLKETVESGQRQIEALWFQCWQRHAVCSADICRALTLSFFWAKIALSVEIRRNALSVKDAEQVLISMAEGVLELN